MSLFTKEDIPEFVSVWNIKMMIGIIIFFLFVLESSAGIHILDLLARYGLTKTYGIKIEPLPRSTEYDFIIVGSGPGGSTVANRLSENRSWKVLLLEAGKPEGLLQQIPLLTISFVNTDYDWQFTAEPQSNACLGITEGRCVYTKGKSLGGSSSINGMIYARGHKLDFDRWAQDGNYGWSYSDILPYYKKSERAKLAEPVDKSYHGKHGNVHVQSVAWHSPLASAFVESGRRLGYDVVDYNGRQQVGFSYTQGTLLNGARCSASQAYLTAKRPNLDIVTEAMVSKILINRNKQVYGVEFIKNNQSYRINACKEVILSAGTFNTPKLLMLSGIGPKEHLNELGIQLVKDAKVGYNFHDDASYGGLTFVVNQSISLISKNTQTPESVLEYAVNGGGPFATPGGVEALAFARTKFAIDDRPDVHLIFSAGSFNMDYGTQLRSSRGVTQEIYNRVWKPLENRDTWSIWPALQNTRSDGRVKLKSTNIADPPVIDSNFLSNQKDGEILLEGIKLAIRLSESEPFQRYGSKLHDIKIPGCEAFPFASDDYWRCTIRHLSVPFNHDAGTAKMGPSSDSSAVVDPELRVYGVTGLRVIDGSIMPYQTTGHFVSTVYMIGEKGADMIKQSW